MRNLLRKPLPWMVVSECAIVAALAMVAWHMVASPAAASDLWRAGGLADRASA